MLISGKKTILFCQNNFFIHKTDKYKMYSVTSLRVVSHEIAQLYMAARKGFKVHLIAAMQFVFIFLKSEDVSTLR